jgi:hypothetical protein
MSTKLLRVEAIAEWNNEYIYRITKFAKLTKINSVSLCEIKTSYTEFYRENTKTDKTTTDNQKATNFLFSDCFNPHQFCLNNKD